MSLKLSAREISLVRGERCLFAGVSFALESGNLLLLEGQNGSGKTSLLKAIVGMLELESGELLWNDKPLQEQRQDFYNSLVWVAHRVGLKADLTLVENLRFEASLRPPSSADFDAALDRLGIARLKKLPIRSLSAGQQRRVALARLLLSGATLWMMDEPFTNLDREGRALVMDLVSEHLGNGGMCIMAAHQDVDIDVPTERLVLR